MHFWKEEKKKSVHYGKHGRKLHEKNIPDRERLWAAAKESNLMCDAKQGASMANLSDSVCILTFVWLFSSCCV